MAQQHHDWHRQAAAEKMCLELLSDHQRENHTLARIAADIREKTSGRLLDWVDHVLVRDSAAFRETLANSGFVPQPDTLHEAWHHPGALLPRIVLIGNSVGPDPGVALRVDSLADFMQANGLVGEIEGALLSPYRRALLNVESGVALLAVERRGSRTYEPQTPSANYLPNYLAGLEMWQTRPRTAGNDDLVLTEATRLIDLLVAQLGVDTAACLVCEAERRYWQSRNFAAGLQKIRQDVLGLGWANQDHHTFRSSRRNFVRLVELFSRLGFRNRERFYAGAEAGWGAQIMENPNAGITLFLDVDLAPEEVATDFSAEKLPERQQYGTVGLWCALHGDSILTAGLHHLAGQFDFVRLGQNLARHGVEFMAPFSDFAYLKQAFSVAERWPVEERRLEKLVAEKSLSAEQAEKFRKQGAVGSHLENIQRCEGYKGFNKKNVSRIILNTDPRR
jgi:hypothetical protein